MSTSFFAVPWRPIMPSARATSPTICRGPSSSAFSSALATSGVSRPSRPRACAPPRRVRPRSAAGCRRDRRAAPGRPWAPESPIAIEIADESDDSRVLAQLPDEEVADAVGVVLVEAARGEPEADRGEALDGRPGRSCRRRRAAPSPRAASWRRRSRRRKNRAGPGPGAPRTASAARGTRPSSPPRTGRRCAASARAT